MEQHLCPACLAALPPHLGTGDEPLLGLGLGCCSLCCLPRLLLLLLLLMMPLLQCLLSAAEGGTEWLLRKRPAGSAPACWEGSKPLACSSAMPGKCPLSSPCLPSNCSVPMPGSTSVREERCLTRLLPGLPGLLQHRHAPAPAAALPCPGNAAPSCPKSLLPPCPTVQLAPSTRAAAASRPCLHGCSPSACSPLLHCCS